ncbi:tetratricopeptide repeat protein [Candidatus Venteria ishoeyi]|uniref:Tetratricopeptide repeat protein n=1 Tax=Candidatus Venteria ishoeyi TaxID=1899563 RepID=A0A1H6FBN2_9GAMM|nr:tetratricopeptide repeat protein [Candidatus Venteria ishoeyi]SEH06729.1 Tetratricopeptide repeat protein [Candidatus Venteria ishoeyi]
MSLLMDALKKAEKDHEGVPESQNIELDHEDTVPELEHAANEHKPTSDNEQAKIQAESISDNEVDKALEHHYAYGWVDGVLKMEEEDGVDNQPNTTTTPPLSSTENPQQTATPIWSHELAEDEVLEWDSSIDSSANDVQDNVKLNAEATQQEATVSTPENRARLEEARSDKVLEKPGIQKKRSATPTLEWLDEEGPEGLTGRSAIDSVQWLDETDKEDITSTYPSPETQPQQQAAAVKIFSAGKRVNNGMHRGIIWSLVALGVLLFAAGAAYYFYQAFKDLSATHFVNGPQSGAKPAFTKFAEKIQSLKSHQTDSKTLSSEQATATAEKTEKHLKPATTTTEHPEVAQLKPALTEKPVTKKTEPVQQPKSLPPPARPSKALSPFLALKKPPNLSEKPLSPKLSTMPFNTQAGIQDSEEAIPTPPLLEALSKADLDALSKKGFVVQRAPKNKRLQARLQQAWQQYQLKNYQQAWNLWQQVLAFAPNNRDALLGAANSALQLNQQQQAQQYYQRVLKYYPDDAIAEAGLARLLKSLPIQSRERRLRQQLQKQPDAATIHFELGNLYHQQGDWSKAQQAYFDAWRYDKQQADYAYNLAVSLDHLKQTRTALDYYYKALNLIKTKPLNATFEPQRVQKRIQTLEKQIHGN